MVAHAATVALAAKGIDIEKLRVILTEELVWSRESGNGFTSQGCESEIEGESLDILWIAGVEDEPSTRVANDGCPNFGVGQPAVLLTNDDDLGVVLAETFKKFLDDCLPARDGQEAGDLINNNPLAKPTGEIETLGTNLIDGGESQDGFQVACRFRNGSQFVVNDRLAQTDICGAIEQRAVGVSPAIGLE